MSESGFTVETDHSPPIRIHIYSDLELKRLTEKDIFTTILINISVLSFFTQGNPNILFSQLLCEYR